MKILFQLRPSAHSHPGGDVALMTSLATALRARGHEITIDMFGQSNPAGFDLVHLTNFTLPDILRAQAERCIEAGVPFVVQALFEDVTRFHFQSHFVAQHLMAGRSWRTEDLFAIERARPFDNAWVVNNASAILTSGRAESDAIKEYYGAKSREVTCGFSLGSEGDSEKYRSIYGDYLLCVGRLESRKNQLMLLKALENSPITIVFVEGEITYQPYYASAVKSFKRKGETYFIKGLSSHELASLYAGAKVHALISWYELPGLVHLEAAALGANVVATDSGTIRDYLGQECYYALPYDVESIRSAVMAAWNTVPTLELRDRARSATWEKMAEQVEEIYKEIVPMSVDIKTVLERGEEAAKEKRYAEAEQLLTEAYKADPNSTRALRAIGAVHLAQERVVEARRAFREAFAIDQQDPKTLSGLGMCEIMQKNYEGAFRYFSQSLDIAPFQLVPIYQLIECSYALDKYDRLEEVLRHYVENQPTDSQMRFCLAGCLYKQDKIPEARELLMQVLREMPEHDGAKELLAMLSPLKSQIEVVRVSEETADIDMKLAVAEDKKRVKEYAEAERILSEIKGTLTEAQTELKACIELELEVVQGRFESAARKVESLAMKYPNSARLRCTRGALALAGGDWNSSRDHFQEALRHNPKSDVALAGVALYEQHQGSESRAWELYSQALQINPENGRAILGAIELGYKLGKLTELESMIGRYVELHPADLDMVYALAGCCFAQGKLREATSHVETIKLFNPAHERAQELSGLIAERSV